MVVRKNSTAAEQALLTQIDHIIILISPQSFANPPPWLSENFTIIEGGTHSKGTSRNKLIIFKDGTYLELFSWTDPQPEGVTAYSDFPSWASKPEDCIIDWALTGKDADVKYEQLMGSLKELEGEGERIGITYDEPREGGRQRKDGQQLRWVTTRPRRTGTDTTPLPVDVPFFCHDVTPRVLRVPSLPDAIPDMPNITNHPCGATGVAGIVIEVAESNLERSTKMYEAILGGHHVPAVRRDGASIFDVAVPNPMLTDQGPRLCSLHLQVSDEENAFAKAKAGTSIRRLVLYTEKDDRKGEQLDRDGFGTPINLC